MDRAVSHSAVVTRSYRGDQPAAQPNGAAVGKRSTKLLFVCSRNKIRSLTAEKLLAGIPGYEARSVGTQPSARIVVTAGHIGWADIIFCMEKSHRQRLQQRFPEALSSKTIITLHIPDEYEFMGENLIEELRSKLAEHVSWPDTR